MSDVSSLSPEGPPQISPPPAERGVFHTDSLLFVLLRIGMYFALAEGVSYALRWIMVALSAGEISIYSPKILTIAEVSSLAGAFAAGIAMSQLEGRSFGDYGLPWRGAFGKLFWQGALFGLAEISAVLGVIATFGFYHFGGLAIHGVDLFRWAAFWGAFFVLVGLYEEFAFRGYVQFTLAQAAGFWPAAVLLSAAFGFVHRSNPGESKMGLAGVVLTGLLWCFSLRRTGNLWFAVGMHASFDFGETFLYSVPDSGVVFPGHLSNATLAGPAWLTGGSAGPEASVCDFAMLLIFFYVFHRLYPARARSASPDSG
ncbi:MAG TPA: CPBP family intramembrane glutamic endopeptidase [Candidatus Saccharimonadales bacterium]|nr:CPBP family intramembrane glutamic endopeptidase [Candidatus Saccharimonadales bacterium]